MNTAVQPKLRESVAGFFANERSEKITVKNQKEFDYVFAEAIKYRCRERVNKINSNFSFEENWFVYAKGLKTLEVKIRA